MSSNQHGIQSPFQQISTEDHGPWVVVASFIFIILAILTVVVRLVSKWQLKRSLLLEDYLILASALLAIAQTGCVTVAVKHGLGKHQESLSDTRFQAYSKANYASELLLIAALASAKASVTVLIMSISPKQQILRACRVLLWAVSLWTITSILALAFQCSLPRPWDFSQDACVHQRALYIVIGVFNILTDFAAAVIPFFLMRNVQIAALKRWMVVGLFASRLLAVIATVLNLATLTQYFDSYPPDQTWYAANPTIWSQVMLNLSIITACLPCLKRVLADLQTGLAASSIPEGFEHSVSRKQSASLGYTSWIEAGSASKLGSGAGIQTQGRHVSSGAARGSATRHGLEDLKYGLRHDHGSDETSNKTAVEQSKSVEGPTNKGIVQKLDYRVQVRDRYASKGPESQGLPPFGEFAGRACILQG